ncbi:sodium-independent sulfate anion transporter-like isoform X2 [Choristoneura fumiferana]|uniref:sodium-independent sulfate anion transporter-like isoform X2 n=1 Tax=Choristoneura fumiferana TaxID=7141 RepID=UPI003D1591B5
MSGVIGHPPDDRRFRRAAAKLCGLESWRRRVPITIWLPTYKLEYVFRDLIAGVTVGLTSIPQGIAYAIIAGLPPQVGLYSSIFPGFVYMLLGSCKDVTVGPTAILAALLAKYVAKSEAFAYLAAFLSGCIIMLLGALQLGFLLDFISKPVISGFTAAAALQIGASQLKSLFRITGSSGSTFIQAVVNFFKNIRTIHLWDPVLGVFTIIILLLLKRAAIATDASSAAWRVRASVVCQHAVRARNALLVFAATLLAYLLYLRDLAPFALTGTITGGLPHFGVPPFSTVVGNQTLDFQDMLVTFGPEGFVMPLVAILESIAIARAFAGSKPVDGTQEMLAVGACNIVSSFCQSMPATGSFTRTALNHASGVVTPAGSMFKALLVLLSVTLLTNAFYFIPRAVLAAVIMVAMVSLVELDIPRRLWRHSKLELLVYSATVVVGCTCGLEYGIAAGAGGDALRALATSARPKLHPVVFKVGNQSCISLTLSGSLSYASAEHCARALRQLARGTPLVIVLDGRLLTTLDLGVAESLVTALVDLGKQQHRCLLWNFPMHLQRLLLELQPSFEDNFVTGPSIDQHILGLEVQRITTVTF